MAGVALGLAVTLQPGPSMGGTAGRPGPTSVNLPFDRQPGAEWSRADCSELGSTTIDHGILTFDSPSGDCELMNLYYPKGVWNQRSRNARGWVVEAALELDPSSVGPCTDQAGNEGGVGLWLADDREVVVLGFAANGVCLTYPDFELAPVTTTDGFHVYRVEARGRIVRIYVDGRLVIDHTLEWEGGGTRSLGFGDLTGSGSTVSRWDYLRYQTRPGFDPADWVGSAWPAGTRQARAARLP